LVLSGNTLYGTTRLGGSSGVGTVFAVNPNGTGFTNLHSFVGFAAYPNGGVILSGNTLYGTTSDGGSAGVGTLFALNTDGTGFTNLHNFMGGADGNNPQAGLILSASTMYGTARLGGSSGAGMVFALNTDGTGFTNLHSFTATSGPSPFTNSGGANPYGGLILSGNTLYGTAQYGGNFYNGTVFSLSLPLLSTPPFIAAPPQNQYVFPGENATFSVSAGGTLPLSYQWRFYDTNLASATDSSFTRVNVQSNDFGNYNVVVTNNLGSITSVVATLGYVLNPVLTNQHLSGGTFTFTLNGNPPAHNYLIQQSTSLPDWSNVLTFSNILGPVSFTETNADVFFKVFRAKIVP